MRSRLRTTMQEAGFPAVVMASPENVFYAAGFNSTEHALLGSDIFAIAFADEADAVALVAPAGWAMNLSRADLPWPVELVPYGSYYPFYAETPTPEAEHLRAAFSAQRPFETAFLAVADVLRGKKIDVRDVGFDLSGMSGATFKTMRVSLGSIELLDASAVITRSRMVKDKNEIELIKRAAVATRSAIESSARQAVEGMSELDLADIFEDALLENGARPRFTFIGFGEHGAFTNVMPGSQVLRRGDLIRYDVGGTVGFYQSDIGRSYSFGAPSRLSKKYYDVSAQAQILAIQMMKPGIEIEAIFDETMRYIHENGIPHAKRKHIGHAIGLSVYDRPLLAPGQQMALEPGMVFCVETPYYEIGVGGFQPEDMVVVTDSGVELLTEPESELPVVD